MATIAIRNVHADGLAPLDPRPCAGTRMAGVSFNKCTGDHQQWLMDSQALV